MANKTITVANVLATVSNNELITLQGKNGFNTVVINDPALIIVRIILKHSVDCCGAGIGDTG